MIHHFAVGLAATWPIWLTIFATTAGSLIWERALRGDS